MIFSKKQSSAPNLKGRVHCNETAQFVLADEVPIPCRMRELNWLGFTLDQIPVQHFDAILASKGQEITTRFSLPREFGRLEIHCSRFTVSQYTDAVDDRPKVQMIFELEDQPAVEKIRDFITYRNRRFSRHSSSRRSTKFFKQTFILKWIFFYPAILILLASALLSLRRYLWH